MSVRHLGAMNFTLVDYRINIISSVDLYKIGTTPSTVVLGRDVQAMEIRHACMYRSTPGKQASGSVRMDMDIIDIRPFVVQKRIGLIHAFMMRACPMRM